METKNRLIYIDNIRLLVIILVVILHISLTYSSTGNWYYIDHGNLGAAKEAFFSFFQTFLQSFFMGFLFLIAGYFVPGAYDRKGFKKFVGSRAIRLGIPALIYMLILDPVIEFFLVKRHTAGFNFFSYCLHNITGGHVLTGNGPLWFAIAVLFFSIIYALIRLVLNKAPAAPLKKYTPNTAMLGALVLIIAAFAFLIRIWLPIVTSFFNMMVCFFAQYIVLFIAGILAYRYDLFNKLSRRYMRLRWLAPLLGFVGWGALMLSCQAFWGSNYTLLNGGFTYQSALFSLLESFTAVAMDVGLLVLFHEKFNRQGGADKSAFRQRVFRVCFSYAHHRSDGSVPTRCFNAIL